MIIVPSRILSSGTKFCIARTEFCIRAEKRGKEEPRASSHWQCPGTGKLHATRPAAPGGYRSAPLRTLSMPRDGQIAGTEGSRGRRRKRERERERVRKRERERERERK